MKNVQVNVTGGNPNASYTYSTYVLKSNKDFLTQDDFNEPNTKYVIKWNFDLLGTTIVIPENCIIEFDGGSLSNGTLVGNNTILIYYLSKKDILHNVNLEGTFIHNSGITINKTTNINGYSIITLEEKDNIIEQITKERTIYKIIYDYDLLGLTINIPDDVIILFEGGSISNGTLVLGAHSSVIGIATNTVCTNLYIELFIHTSIKNFTLEYTHKIPVGQSLVLFDYQKVWNRYIPDRQWVIEPYFNIPTILVENINFIGKPRTDGWRNDVNKSSSNKEYYGGTGIAFINYVSNGPELEADIEANRRASKGAYTFVVRGCYFTINLLSPIYCDTSRKSWFTVFRFEDLCINGTNYGFLFNREIDTNPANTKDNPGPKGSVYGQDCDHNIVTWGNNVGYDVGNLGSIIITNCDVQSNTMMFSGLKADNTKHISITGSHFWDFMSSKYHVPYLFDLDSYCYGFHTEMISLGRGVYDDTTNTNYKAYNYRWKGKPEGYDGYSYSVYGIAPGTYTIGKDASMDAKCELRYVLPKIIEADTPITLNDIFNEVPEGIYMVDNNSGSETPYRTNICNNLGIDVLTGPHMMEIMKSGPLCKVFIYPCSPWIINNRKTIYEASFYYRVNPDYSNILLKDLIAKHVSYSPNELRYDTTTKGIVVNDSTDPLGFPNYLKKGTTAQRPKSTENGGFLTSNDIGYIYYDTDLHSYIWYAGLRKACVPDSEKTLEQIDANLPIIKQYELWHFLGTNWGAYRQSGRFYDSDNINEISGDVPNVWPFDRVRFFATDLGKYVYLQQNRLSNYKGTEDDTNLRLETGDIINTWKDNNRYTPVIEDSTTYNRPTEKLVFTDLGFPYRDRSIGKTIYFKADQGNEDKRWLEYDGVRVGTPRIGTSNERPNGEYIKDLYNNFVYFDTTLNIPIYAKIIFNNDNDELVKQVKWIKSDGSSADAKKCGTIEELPNSSDIYDGYVYMLQTKLNNVVISSTPIYYDNNKWYYSSGELVTIT